MRAAVPVFLAGFQPRGTFSAVTDCLPVSESRTMNEEAMACSRPLIRGIESFSPPGSGA